MLRTSKRSAALALALAVGLLAVGCSGGGDDDDVASLDDPKSDSSDKTDQQDAEAELTEWVKCMQDEGVPLPDPTRDKDGNLVVDGNGIHLGGGGDSFSNSDSGDQPDGEQIDPQDMDKAQEKCGQPPATGAGEISDEDRKEQEAKALEFAKCMRAEGIEDFPDPVFQNGPGGRTQSSSKPDEGGGGGDGPTINGPFGQIDLGDAEVRAAFEKCQDKLGMPGDLPPEPDQGANP
jgi:hypothetical protein